MACQKHYAAPVTFSFYARQPGCAPGDNSLTYCLGWEALYTCTTGALGTGWTRYALPIEASAGENAVMAASDCQSCACPAPVYVDNARLEFPPLLRNGTFAGLAYWGTNGQVTHTLTPDFEGGDGSARLAQLGILQQSFTLGAQADPLYLYAEAYQDFCPDGTIYAQLCIDAECYTSPVGRKVWTFAVQHFHNVTAGTHTAYVRYYAVGCATILYLDRVGLAYTEPITPPVPPGMATPTPWVVVPPSPTPRYPAPATPQGVSDIDHVMGEGTLVIGWVGPALLGILLVAFTAGTRVFEWLGALVEWLLSGQWRG